jgi:hypothetical protein
MPPSRSPSRTRRADAERNRVKVSQPGPATPAAPGRVATERDASLPSVWRRAAARTPKRLSAWQHAVSARRWCGCPSRILRGKEQRETGAAMPENLKWLRRPVRHHLCAPTTTTTRSSAWPARTRGQTAWPRICQRRLNFRRRRQNHANLDQMASCNAKSLGCSSSEGTSDLELCLISG